MRYTKPNTTRRGLVLIFLLLTALVLGHTDLATNQQDSLCARRVEGELRQGRIGFPRGARLSAESSVSGLIGPAAYVLCLDYTSRSRTRAHHPLMRRMHR